MTHAGPKRWTAPLVAAAVILSATTVSIGLATPAGAGAPVRQLDAIALTVESSPGGVALGEQVALTVTATNNAATDSSPIVVHLDVTDPAQTTSVDPEDWTATLNQLVGTIGPGRSITVDWALQPVAAGTYAVYAVALSQGAADVAASNVVEVTVSDQRSLDPSGILPVAVIVPSAVGALLLFQTRRARRQAEGDRPSGQPQ